MRFGIVGDPVDHSRSPVIHNAAYRFLGIDASFEPIQTSADLFESVVSMLRSGELAGVNVTMPHKHNAYACVDEHTAVAIRTGAVNTITVDNGRLIGHNTDVAGVISAWERLGTGPDSPSLILGAGGAAAAALVARDGHQVFISTRNPDHARDLVAKTGVPARLVPWAEGVAGAVLINATPIGMHGGTLPDDPIFVASGLLDMAYGDTETAAVAAFRGEGLPVSDGIDMLVGQAVEGFERFVGQPAPLDVMMAAARASIG